MRSEDKIIAIFCLVDDMLKSIGHYEPAGRKLSDAEVITTALVSALYYHGHQDNARMFMKITRLMPRTAGKEPLQPQATPP